MENVSFDPSKDAANFAKHGVSLALAARLEWESALTWPDTRRAYGEFRHCALGYVGARLYVAVFVERGDGLRIISMRKANAREVRRYAET